VKWLQIRAAGAKAKGGPLQKGNLPNGVCSVKCGQIGEQRLGSELARRALPSGTVQYVTENMQEIVRQRAVYVGYR
jgi:hypothetical protein